MISSSVPAPSQPRSHVYFASDMHLGSRHHRDPLAVERKLSSWLYSIAPTARAVVLVGDVFDYWFEYKYVVPKGFTRVLGALAYLADQGVEIHLFTGNHDVWMFGYLEAELGAIVHKEPALLMFDDHLFYVAHGDEHDYSKRSFRFIRAIFHSHLCQRLYATIHPRWSSALAHGWSLSSRRRGLARDYHEREYQGENREYLVQFARSYISSHPDRVPHFFVFGHRHILLDLMLSRESRVVVLGDWISHFSYAEWDGSSLLLNTLAEE